MKRDKRLTRSTRARPAPLHAVDTNRQPSDGACGPADGRCRPSRCCPWLPVLAVGDPTSPENVVCSTSSAPRKPAGQVISLWCCCRAAASRFRFLRLKVGRSRVRHTLRLSLGLCRIAKKGPGAWRLDLLDLISSLPSTLHSISSSCFACFPSTLNLNHRPNRTDLLTLNLTPHPTCILSGNLVVHLGVVHSQP